MHAITIVTHTQTTASGYTAAWQGHAAGDFSAGVHPLPLPPVRVDVGRREHRATGHHLPNQSSSRGSHSHSLGTPDTVITIGLAE
jgi:hypothetical protein